MALQLFGTGFPSAVPPSPHALGIGARALLTPVQRAELESAPRRDLAGVRALLGEHAGHAGRDGALVLDAGLVVLIDSTASGPIFVVGGDMFDRESLAAAVPLGAFAVAPERLFSRQRVGWVAGELAVWDVDPDDDQSGALGIDTRVYVAREAFADFRAVAAAARGAARVAAAGGASLLALAAPSPAPSPAPTPTPSPAPTPAPAHAHAPAPAPAALETRLAALEARLATLEARLG